MSSLVTPMLSTAVKQIVPWPKRRRPPVAPQLEAWVKQTITPSKNVIAFGSYSANNVVWRLRVDSQRDNNYTEYYKLYNHKITAVDKQIWSKH